MTAIPSGRSTACSGPILDGFDEDWALEARDEHAHRLGEALEQAAAGRRGPGRGDPADARPGGARPARGSAQPPTDRAARGAAATAPRRWPPDGSSPSACARSSAIPPSRETRALLDELRRAEPAPVPPPPVLTRAYDTEFVGRRAELERLRASWGGVQMHRDRRIVLIAGEPGIGKTRLAQQFASSRARRRRHRPARPLLRGAAGAVRAVHRGAGSGRRRRRPAARRQPTTPARGIACSTPSTPR